MARRRGERTPGYWPRKVNRGQGWAGRRRGGPREGAECARRAAAAGEAREAAARSLRAEPSRADRHPAPAPASDPGRRRGPAGPAAPQPMELENIVANTVLLKAREGEAAEQAAGCGERGRAASELGWAPQSPDPLGQRAPLPSPRTPRRGELFRPVVLRTCPGVPGPRKGRGSGHRPRGARGGVGVR